MRTKKNPRLTRAGGFDSYMVILLPKVFGILSLTMPHSLSEELIRQRALIMPEVRNVQQFPPVAFKVTVRADEVIQADVTFDLPHDKAVRCHHEGIDLRSHPALPEDVPHD